MESYTVNLIKNYRPIKWTAGLLGALLIGALGNGLWELVLRDLLVSIGNITLTFISSIWVGYIDSLHRNIGKLHQDSLTLPLFSIAVVLLIFGPWVVVSKLIQDSTKLKKEILREEDDGEPVTLEQVIEKLNRVRRKIFWRLIPLVALMTAFYAVQIWQTTYTRNASNWAERSVEILRPYISQQEFTMLRSDLRRVENAEHFYAFEEKLKRLSKRESVNLPEFTVIKRQVHKRRS